MAARLVAFALLRIALSSIIFDDMDKGPTVHSSNMEATGLDTCRADAHAGDFHHDGGKNKGNASFEFKFDVPQSGCYSLEEYHPGRAVNSNCSKLLTTNAKLDVDWCIGRKSVINLDQSKHGGQWNFVDIFPFFVGYPGVLKISNPAGSEGQHLIVDAFRITRVADKCTASLLQKLWRESEARKQAIAEKAAAEKAATDKAAAEKAAAEKSAADKAAMPNAVKAHTSLPSWREGALHLSVQSKAASGSIDLLANLKAQTATIEATLRNHLKARSVIVKAILPLDARRLSGCRRLEAVANSFDFNVRFTAKVTDAMTVTEAALASELSTAFVAAGAKFQVDSVELIWKPIDAIAGKEKEANSDSGSNLPFILGGVAGVLILVVAVAVWLSIRHKKVTPTGEAQKELEEGQNEKPQEEPQDLYEADKKVDGKVQESIDDNASTATPSSDTLKDIETLTVE